MRPWRYNLCALQLVRYKTIDLFFTTSLESLESHLYKHISRSIESFSACTFALYNAAASLASLLYFFAQVARWQLLSNISFNHELLGIFINRYGPMGGGVEWKCHLVRHNFSIIPSAEHNFKHNILLSWVTNNLLPFQNNVSLGAQHSSP